MYSEIGAQVVSGARMRAKAAKILRRRAIVFGVVLAYSSASLVKAEVTLQRAKRGPLMRYLLGASVGIFDSSPGSSRESHT